MAAPDSLETLTARFIELWQQQCAGVAQDPSIIEASLRLMQRLQPLYTGNPYVAPVPSDHAQPLSQLPERVAALEKRVAELESQLAAASRATAEPVRSPRRTAARKRVKEPAH